MARAPLTLVIVLLGFSLSLFSWIGLRSIETSEAELSYERVLLAQGSQLNAEVLQVRSAMSLLAAELSLSGDVAAFDSSSSADLLDSSGIRELVYLEAVRDVADEVEILERETRLGNTEFVSGYGANSSAEGVRPELVLSRVKPEGTGIGILGRDVTSILDRLAGEELDLGNGVGVLSSSDAAAVFSEVYGYPQDPNTPVALFYAPVGSAARPDGYLVTQVYLVDLLEATVPEGEQVALELARDGEPLVATMSADELGEPFGTPTTFSDSASEWTIQGFTGGLDADHRGSWAALVTGLVLAMVGGLFSTSARRHAITLGRLERSEYDARHDQLTGLLNRAGITDSLSAMLAQRSANDLVGVLFLDLDRLKVINDSIGHSAGDEVLAVVASRLASVVRSDDLVGRFGGDEFVIASSDIKSIGDLENSAERILAELREPVILADESSQMVSASIGIASTTSTAESAEELLRDADLAMYRAKETGGARFAVFDSELRSEALARLEVERELRRAIRTGQLVVHFQPIVDLATGSVNRLEALVRWQHPTRGMVPPGKFLSVAAESGLIVDVGEHVLREACRQVALWSNAVGRPISVSVNVAERQLIDSSLVDTVRRVLAETGVRPDQLELEITEELIVEKLDARLTILRKLDAMGIKLAIDDFGTSRASLSQLKRLDMVSTLKIDRAFVIDVATDPVDRKILTAIVALADSMGMEVVAEGVEYAEQVVILGDLGVDFIQGFFFQRPGPSERIIRLLQKTFDVPTAESMTQDGLIASADDRWS